MGSQRKTEHIALLTGRIKNLTNPTLRDLRDYAIKLVREGYRHDGNRILDLVNKIEGARDGAIADFRDTYDIQD